MIALRPALAAAALAVALPVLAAAPAQAVIEIEEVTSPGGIEAWLVEDHEIPFVALEIRFEGGASLDADGKRGAINLMAALLDEGAGDLDAQGFDIAVEGLAAEFDFDAGDDTLAVSARALTENRDEAMALLRSALVAPRFDADALERARAQVLANIESAAKDPQRIASDRFDALAFGDHPYGSSYRGTAETVADLTAEDLGAAKDRVMARDRVHVAAVGDITAEELGALLDTLLGDLPETGAPLPGPADWQLDGGVTVVDFDTPQSVISFGQPGIARDDPDFFPAFVVSQIFGGGGLNSRLMEEVRRERGLTYGVYAGIALPSYAPMIMGRTSTVNARAAETVDVIETEWARIAQEGITAEELDRAKTYLTGAYPLRFDGNGRIANILVGMQVDDMPVDYVNFRNDRVEAVTLEDANRVAGALFRPEDVHFVVVGRPEGLAPAN